MDYFRLPFAYTDAVPSPLLTAVQVLSILLERLEKRIEVLTMVNLRGHDASIWELRQFAKMLRKARDYMAEREDRSGARRPS